MSNDVLNRLEGIEQLGAKLQKAVQSLQAPVYPHRDGRGYSVWSADDETLPATAEAASARSGIERALPRNYAPYHTWKSFGDYLRDGWHNHKTTDWGSRLSKAVQGLSEGVGSDAGFTVLPEFSHTILDRLYSHSLYERTDNYIVSGNSMTFPRTLESSRADGQRHGGLRGYWIGEGNPIPSSKPTVGELSLKLKKLAIVCYLTQELLDDTGIALEQYIVRKVASELQFMLGDAIVNGTGVGQPLGILNSPALLTVAKESSQAAATVQAENIVKMWSRLFSPHRANAVWLINQEVEPQLHLLTIGSGSEVVYMPPGGLSATPYGSIFGRPVLPIEFCGGLGTQGDIVLADLSQYVTIGKGGVVQAQSMHVEFLTDQLAMRFTLRVDGAPWETSPVTPYKGTSTQGSFVTLEARA